MAKSWPSLTEGTWNKVITNKKTGVITRLKSNFKFYITSVATGAAAPADAVKDKSPIAFEDSKQVDISDAAALDVYLWIENADTATDSTVADAVEVDS